MTRQELDRMQKVIKEVHESLCDLKLAIDGTIVMSPSLRASLDAMYDARIPEKWMKVHKLLNSHLIWFIFAVFISALSHGNYISYSVHASGLW